MPELFYIDEKKHVFKYFDFEKQLIEIKAINIDKLRIPMFTGVGSVASRIFMFGGKDTITKEITTKAFELKKVDENSYEI